jgi:hypothetical protein
LQASETLLGNMRLSQMTLVGGGPQQIADRACCAKANG